MDALKAKQQTLLPAQNYNVPLPAQLRVASIGAVYWVNHHRDAAHRRQVDTLELYDDRTSLGTFIQRTGITEQQLEQYAVLASSIGVNLKSPTKIFPFTAQDPPKNAEVFRSIPSTWDSLEGTIPHNPIAVNTRRLSHFFNAGTNTCAPDCVYSLAVICNVWLIQRDRITPRLRTRLSPPARILYDICTQMYLPERTSGEHEEFRDTLTEELYKYDKKKFPMGDYMELMDVFQAVFMNAPQFTWHQVSGVVCCDGIPQIFERRGKVVTRCHLEAGSPAPQWPTLGDFITSKFSSPREMEGHIRCTTAKEKCTHNIRSVNVVLDCLPARLTLRSESGTKNVSKKWGLGEDLQFQYYNCQMKLSTARYAPESCVLHLNRNHYVLLHRRISPSGRWETLEWDHLGDRTVKVRPGKDWYHGKSPKAAIYLVVYRLVQKPN